MNLSIRTWTEFQCDKFFTNHHDREEHVQKLSLSRQEEVNRSIEIEQLYLERIQQFPPSTEKRVIALCLVRIVQLLLSNMIIPIL